MANAEHLAEFKEGTEAWNAWRQENRWTIPDLSGGDLRGAILFMTNLRETNLSGANLYGANCSEASIYATILADLNLRVASGLETVKHIDPSTIGIDTIYRSQGDIPDVFLRGCGVPDDMISYIHSVAGAIRFYSCFIISYSTDDQEFAERLHADLQVKGLCIWFAPEDIKGGRKIHEQIDQAIRQYDKLLLILSEASMNSEWVKTEIYNARQEENRTGKRKLFPNRQVSYEGVHHWSAFDADIGKDMAREVREYFIPDFSDWKDHDA